MRPPDAGGTSLTRPCVAVAWFPLELIGAVTCCTQYSHVSEPGNKNNTTQWHDTGNISNKSRVRTEVDATNKKMLDPITGSPATRKPWIKTIVLSTTVAELYYFMKCFGSRQFLRGLWMKKSGEVAKIHMTTGAKNVASTARTIHLPEQKDTIHMISMLRKEACSGSIHYLAHIPTQNCLADCRTMASAKADNLITEVKTVELLEVDIHPNFRTLLEQNTFLSTCRTFRHTRVKDVFFLNALKEPLAQTPQEGPFHVMLVRNQHTQEPKP